MRRNFRHVVHRPIRRGFRCPIGRAGGLLGLVGMAALGYKLLEKHQREQARSATVKNYVWDDNTDLPDPS